MKGQATHGKNYQLSIRLAGKEAEVVQAVKDMGIDSAMASYGIKTKSAFTCWLREHTLTYWAENPLSGVDAGPKSLWLRQHRSTILDCLEIFGKNWVLANFRLTPLTLEKVISLDHRLFTGLDRKLTRLERVELDTKDIARKLETVIEWQDRAETRFQMAEETPREYSKEVRQLKEDYAEFTNLISSRLTQGIEKVLRVLLGQVAGSESPLSLAGPNPLGIDTLQSEAKQSKGRGRPKKIQEVETKPQLPVKLREAYLQAFPRLDEPEAPPERVTEPKQETPPEAKAETMAQSSHCKKCGGNIVTSYGERGCLQCGAEPKTIQRQISPIVHQ
jgi:hypothetical protein